VVQVVGWPEHFKRANINRTSGATCHTFRHTFASHLVMASVPLFTVQRLLGHAQIDTTMIYAHLAEDHSAANGGNTTLEGE